MLPKLTVRPTTVKQKKQFSIQRWDGTKSGEKIILYAASGMGKTTLASMAPNPVFIGLDDGGRKIHNPKTGELLWHIPGIETFEDVREALQACLTLDCDTVVIDTITELELLAEQFVLKTIKVSDRNNNPSLIAEHMERYGWGKGYRHLYDTMRLPLLNLDRLIAAGKNVIAVAQLNNHKKANDLGEEFLKEGPQLYNGPQWSVYNCWVRWADHIFRIAYETERVKDGTKKAVGGTTRVIETQAGLSFEAKSRTITEPKITFNQPDDDSVWRFLFGGK